MIERMFRRLKNFRRIATRYDKPADTFLSAVRIAATIVWRLNRLQTLVLSLSTRARLAAADESSVRPRPSAARSCFFDSLVGYRAS